jgi:hypothetical protein
MRVMTLVLGGMLAASLIYPADAARRSSSQMVNPDRQQYQDVNSCGGGSCYRSGRQKSQKTMHHHKTAS